MMRTIIKNAASILTMNPSSMRIDGGYVVIKDTQIAAVGSGDPDKDLIDGANVIDASGKVLLPGLVNTHHHMYQTLTRAVPSVQNAKLFDWLKRLYPIWAKIGDEGFYYGALIAMSEMMLSGCTTTTDHQYLFPKGTGKILDAQIEAGRQIGMRFHPTRGSMSLSEKDGGLPPDSVVQDEDEILADSERVVKQYHDPNPGAMTRIALAPCSPFSVTQGLMKKTADLARKLGVRLHTHLAETKDEEQYCLELFGRRPVDYLEDNDWMSGDVWLGHGIFFDDEEVKRLGHHHMGIAHCPSSNMRLGSGFARVNDLFKAGAYVGLGVDGSASNDSSHMLGEARQAMLLTRVKHGADAMTAIDALRLATVGGAQCLGRDDIGSIEVGKAADIAIFDLSDVGFSGNWDPVAALLFCQSTRVSTLIVNGRVVVDNGQLLTIDLDDAQQKHRSISEKLR
ncbi:MAG TPA: 8-oxoguanine deaminase [Blastocatellia bacterium]|nr:8-oxoguanine deaminase [Blastocatellia bacterium]